MQNISSYFRPEAIYEASSHYLHGSPEEPFWQTCVRVASFATLVFPLIAKVLQKVALHRFAARNFDYWDQRLPKPYDILEEKKSHLMPGAEESIMSLKGRCYADFLLEAAIKTGPLTCRFKQIFIQGMTDTVSYRYFEGDQNDVSYKHCVDHSKRKEYNSPDILFIAACEDSGMSQSTIECRSNWVSNKGLEKATTFYLYPKESKQLLEGKTMPYRLYQFLKSSS